MEQFERFRMVASGSIAKIHTLEVDRKYPVQFAQRLETQNGLTVLLNLRVDSETNIKMFLTKW